MSTPLIAALGTRYGVPDVDETSIDAFLAPAAGEPAHALLFFTGDPRERGETHDVAVVLPELLRAFAGRLRAAVVSRAAEAALKARFGVNVFPSLVLARGADPVAVLPKIRDWSDYCDAIERGLDPDAPVLAAASGPRVEITYTRGERT